MDEFYDYVIKTLTSGISRKDVYRNVIEKGYKETCKLLYQKI